jgi:CMP-N-acetylneuraminic acid synthetase
MQMLLDKRILVVVPARGGSKGIKLKNIRPLKGVPLVALVGKVVKQLPYIDRSVVSTDHPEIARIAKEAGIDVPFMRPEKISGDKIPDWPVLKHALQATEKDDNERYDVIVMLQPTSPLRKPEHITATIEKLINGNYDAVWTLSETDSKYHPLKQLILKGNQIDYYDIKGEEIIARQQLAPTYHRNGVAYAISRDCLVNQKSIKGQKASAVIINEPTVNIDTEDDLKFAELYSQDIEMSK